MNLKNLPTGLMSVKVDPQAFIAPTALDRWNENLRAADSDASNHIDILELIGENCQGEGVSLKKINARLKELDGADAIVNLNTPGGNYFEGLGIYEAFRNYSGKITMRIMGVAASCGAVIAMAGDSVEIGRSSFLMIHNVWTFAVGDRHEFREIADLLEPFDAAAADIFAARASIDRAEIVKQLDRETWINGEKAVADGFADKLLDADFTVSDPENSAKSRKPLNQLDSILAQIGMSRKERREFISNFTNSSKPGAADDAMPRAGNSLDNEAIEALINAL